MAAESEGWLPEIGDIRYEPGYNNLSGTGEFDWDLSSRQIFPSY